MVVHRDHAEQMIVVLGDGLPRPVLVDVADDEVLEVTAEGALMCGHGRDATQPLPSAPSRGGRAGHCCMGSVSSSGRTVSSNA